MDYLNGFTFTLDNNNLRWKKYFDGLGRDGVGVYSVSKYFYDNLKDALLKIFEGEVDIASLSPLSEKSLNLSKDSFSDWNLTYKDYLSEGEMCCIAIPGYLYKGTPQSCFSIVNNIVKKQVTLSDSVSISEYAQLVEDLFVLRFGKKPQDLTDAHLEYFIPAQQIVVSQAVINTVGIKDNNLEMPINPEVRECKETVVEGYFYKRSTGQADSKNIEYKGNSKKVYSVEDFKESYTTGDCTDLNCEYDSFRYISYVIMKECTTTNLDEYKAVAFTSKNHADAIKKTWRALMASGYSSVSGKKELLDTDKTAKANLSRRAVIFVLENNNDITDGAEFWDGEDFLAFGDCETKYDANKTGSNKFKEYKFIEIPKNVYDSYSGSITFPRSFLCSHDETKCEGTHTHFDGNDGKRRAKYLSIAGTFTDKANWKNNVFYVETSVNKPNGISATMAAGKSIFWKETKERLYND
ncbi:MAG: hypothetical protein NC489_29465 [Ruminococcus flavefaciens]|nr:hypothetical protein [Ruminococcus flavefaciens]